MSLFMRGFSLPVSPWIQLAAVLLDIMRPLFEDVQFLQQCQPDMFRSERDHPLARIMDAIRNQYVRKSS